MCPCNEYDSIEARHDVHCALIDKLRSEIITLRGQIRAQRPLIDARSTTPVHLAHVDTWDDHVG